MNLPAIQPFWSGYILVLSSVLNLFTIAEETSLYITLIRGIWQHIFENFLPSLGLGGLLHI